MIDKLQHLKGKTKLEFYKNRSNYYDELKQRNFQNQEDLFARNARGISKVYHEVLLIMKFLQTKPQVKNMDNNFYDLYYTVIKSRDENNNVDDQYEDVENDYINFEGIVPNIYIGRKNDYVMLW